jgi:hypothetical protein
MRATLRVAKAPEDCSIRRTVAALGVTFTPVSLVLTL